MPLSYSALNAGYPVYAYIHISDNDTSMRFCELRIKSSYYLISIFSFFMKYIFILRLLMRSIETSLILLLRFIYNNL